VVRNWANLQVQPDSSYVPVKMHSQMSSLHYLKDGYDAMPQGFDVIVDHGLCILGRSRTALFI